MKRYYSLLLLCLPMLAATSAHASILLGTTVTGSLTGNGGVNVFDPANLSPPVSFVPAGDLNAAGPTVTIQNPAIEFGAATGDPAPGDNFVQLQADFTDTTLTIDYQLHLPIGASSPVTLLVFQFVDPAFSGLPVTETSDTFTNGGLNFLLSGNTLTLTWPGETIAAANVPQVFDRQASYSFVSAAAVPEPGTMWLIGCGAALILVKLVLASPRFQRRRHR